VIIRPIVQSDWREYRDIRLRMLAEIPLAFGETLSTAQRRGEVAWRHRASSNPTGTSIRLVAIDSDSGEWAGTMGGFLSPDDGNRAVLVGVYVAPAYRGSESGVTDALLAGVENWAHRFGDTLLLHVHEENARARAAYAKRGFTLTGVTLPYVLDTTSLEVEMIKNLTSE
jgi:GNAT superfamily N-acetyltransferase